MAGPVVVADGGIVLGALIDVLDQQRDGCAGRQLCAHAVISEYAREDLHLVGLAPLSDEAARARAAAVEPGLDVGRGERQPGWTAIDDAAERRPVALTPRRHAKQMTECVVRHAWRSECVESHRLRKRGWHRRPDHQPAIGLRARVNRSKVAIATNTHAAEMLREV